MKNKILFISFCLFSCLWAETKVYTQVASQVVGSHQSVNEVRPIALLEAKRLVLEQAGTYVESVTVSQDCELTRDEVFSLTAGIIYTQVIDEKLETISGAAVKFTITIQATVDLAKLEEEIERLKKGSHQSDILEENKELRERNATLEKELKEHQEKMTQAQSENEAEALRQEEQEKELLKKAKAYEDLDQARSEIQQAENNPKHYQKALQILLEIETNYPQLEFTAYYQGQIAKKQNEPLDVQTQHFETSLALNSQFSLGHGALARSYLDAYRTHSRKEYYLQAVTEAKLLLKKNPNQAKGYLLLAQIHHEAGNTRLEEKTLRTCVQNVPQTPSNLRDLRIATSLLNVLGLDIELDLPLFGK